MTERRHDASVVDAIVVGGGVAGLVAAHTLVGEGLRPVVLEASRECGGYLARGDVGLPGAPVWVDTGAESFAARSTTVAALVADLGLSTCEPSGLSAWCHVPRGGAGAGGPGAGADHSSAGQSFPLPRTGVLGIPGHPWAADTRRAIGLAGALRAWCDTVLPRGQVDRANLATLVRSRLGRRVLDRLVVPVAGGVHSTDPALLSVDAVAPGLLAAYDRTGSLTAAVRSLRAQAPAGSAVHGLPGGMNQLVAGLEAAVEADGSIRRSTSVDSLSRDGAGWLVQTADGATLRSRRVVVAVDGHSAVRLLHGLVDLHGAAPDRGTDIALVTLLLRSSALDTAPRGTGILVAPGTTVAAKASTHASAKWPWLRERLDALLGADAHVVRLSYGRGDSVETAQAHLPAGDDAALVTQAVADVQALYGVALDPSQVMASLVTRWDDALAPPTPQHRERVERLLAEVERLGSGLTVTGAWVAGTGLAAVVPHAQRAASAGAPTNQNG